MFVFMMLMWIQYETNLQILGVQTQVQCEKHILPLIASTMRTNKYEYGKMNFSGVQIFM